MSVTPIDASSLLDVHQAASFLGVSETWVRRHLRGLSAVKVGRLVRFDPQLLHRQFQGRTEAGNRLKPERIVPMGFKRYQRGSVLKKGSKGKQIWYGMWREDVPNPDGGFTRRQRNVKIGPVSELTNKAMALERLAILMNQKPTTRQSFEELFERWKAVVVPTIKNSTSDTYIYNLKSYIVPAFGNRQVSEISRYDVETFLADKAKMFCRNTLRGMRASLSRVLSWAVACDWIEKNPCAGVRLPLAGSKVKRTILTTQQVAAIAARLEEPYSTLVIFLAATGLRIGEAIGIKWSDFEGDTVHIRRRIYERKEGTTKTKSSERSIPVPSALLERMKLLGEGEWVFRSRSGTPVDPKNAANRYLRPVAKELGIALGGWHDFRHTLSTQLLKRYPTKVVSELLGHSSVQTTLSVYQHVETEDFRAPLNERATELLCDVIKSSLAAA
jgi:integrase